ncbi:hypothetical protein DL89DRAFT_90264 [Linderina pennispora]|uniref:RanBP2-type domain-containing protein n=1 Tax=Linderina pennispora TaxID=61395 RepID=A0A1Y1WIB6_9FUNG|nr:uncharacterized protein DL89DRAFT_90264 [Linderina pennispora]ORX73243.1 hypothetical protein DL89DRAFT_90264 [Linderina pennispora]
MASGCARCAVSRAPDSADKCIVCEAPKPRLAPTAPAASTTVQPSAGWGQPSLGTDEWKCPTCDCKSPTSSNKCIVCEAPKPAPAPVAPTNDIWKQTAVVKTGQWKCSVCDLLSPDSADKCTVCEAPRPGSKPVQPLAAPVPASSSKSFWGQPCAQSRRVEVPDM